MEQAIRLYVPLRRDEAEQLLKVAVAERRRPADQAAYLLSKALAAETEKTEQRTSESRGAAVEVH